jgi:hypothetical protein
MDRGTARLGRSLDHEDAAAEVGCGYGAALTGRTGANHDQIVLVGHVWPRVVQIAATAG